MSAGTTFVDIILVSTSSVVTTTKRDAVDIRTYTDVCVTPYHSTFKRSS